MQDDNIKVVTAEEWGYEYKQRLATSERQEEIKRCNDLLALCDTCANRKKTFTCGTDQCEKGYACLACSFLKWVGSGVYPEDELVAPPSECESYEPKKPEKGYFGWVDDPASAISIVDASLLTE